MLPGFHTTLAVHGSGAEIGALETLLGPALRYQYQVPASDSPLITIDGSDTVEQLNDWVSGSTTHMVQATAASRPQYGATAGLNGRPGITIHSRARFLSAAISVAAGNRVALYAGVKAPLDAFNHVHVNVRGPSPGTIYYLATDPSTSEHRMLCAFSGGSQNLLIGTPAPGSTHRVFAIRPAASGAVAEIDNAPTSPNYTGTDTVAEMNLLAFGNHAVADASALNAVLSFIYLVDLSSDVAARHQHVIDHINTEYATAY